MLTDILTAFQRCPRRPRWPQRVQLGLAVLAGLLVVTLARADKGQTVQMAPFSVSSPRVALQQSTESYAMPVTTLRFEPLVDVEARGPAESQADVTIRGGTFLNTGFRIGGVSLFDPQTGHYYAGIPVSPALLTSPRVLTGVNNALEGFNAAVGTIDYQWRRITPGGEFSAAGGQYDTYQGDIYAAVVGATPVAGRTVAADADVARSTSDGSVPFGDHRFQRYNVRLQLAGESSQTDLFYGYQSKFFGWPNLYTPFGSDETENLETVLVALNHRQSWGAGNWLQAAGFWRRNKDDYAFNRFAPLGPVHPYQHTTWVDGMALSGHENLGTFGLDYNAAFMADDLKSTSLIYGRFHTRSYVKFGVTPEKSWALGVGRRLNVRAGATYDDTNRDRPVVSPLAEVSLGFNRSGQLMRRIYASYAEATQEPSYTALNSSPTAGLFRGDPNLGRMVSHSVELGYDGSDGAWQEHIAVFYRRDDNLVDWTFQKGVIARMASAVNIGTVGVEAVLRRTLPRGEVILGYTWLHKNADYGAAKVDGSFYALNFPMQRLTAAIILRLGGGFELRMDNEARIQKPNPLRTAGGNDAVISSLGLFYRPPDAPNADISLQVDNLWNSSFQEVPAVPAARRQISIGMASRW